MRRHAVLAAADREEVEDRLGGFDAACGELSSAP